MITRNNEKQLVAFSSVLAAVFLVTIKAVVGYATGSLGILSEAAHSALDLGAALVTLFAVRISDKPPDADHTYGHGKIESFSALIETLLLLATCGWIIYEAFERLLFGKSIAVTNTAWGIGIMVLSIAIDISRSRALKKMADKYNSQALEADALHFSSDVWSSLVVISGLACVSLGNYFKVPLLHYADPVAALGVSLLVMGVSLKLGKRTIDVLLDTTPQGMIAEISRAVRDIQGVLDIASVRVRPSGPLFFIDLNVGISKNESHSEVHGVVHKIRAALRERFPNSDIIISTYPIDVAGNEEKETYRTVKKIVDRFPVCTNIHNIHVYDISEKRHIAVHIEVKENLSLEQSHELSHEITALIQQQLPDVRDVNVTFESAKQRHIVARDVTDQSADLIGRIDKMINKAPDKLNCHDIKVFSQGEKVSVFLHCGLKGNYQSELLEKLSKNISRRIKKTFSRVDSVHIHVEPIDVNPDDTV
jgi:cation diffusion facilitator family transporter